MKAPKNKSKQSVAVSSSVRQYRRVWATFVAGAIMLAFVMTAWAQAPDSSERNVYRGAERVDVATPYSFRGDLRRVRRAVEWRSGDPIKEIPRRFYPREGLLPDAETLRSSAQGPDPLVETQRRALRTAEIRTFTSTPLSFEGHNFSGVNPPDTVGDVGLNFYIQMVNSSGGATFTIYNKSDGTVAAGPTTLDSMGSGECADGLGDPIVLFDSLANRWLLSEFSNSGNRLCVYISESSDPVGGGWFNYSFQAPTFPDYPKYGVWADAYYVTSNETPDPAVYALDRSQMLLGGPAAMLRFTAPSLSGFGFQALTPSDLDGANPPPTDSPSFVVRHRDDERHNAGGNNTTKDFIEIWELVADFDNPANSTLTGPNNIQITEFDSGLCGFTSFSCFEQPDPGARKLDPLREVVMRRFQYRNFGTHETLVGNLVTDVDGTDWGGIRWYELRRSNGGSWSLFQEGTYAPDSNNRFMGSVAMDGDGNIALGYNAVGPSLHPSLRYAGRLASDPTGTLPHGEITMAAGSASNGSERYGDYSSLSIDPVDDCTFWLTGEYNPSTLWSTKIGTISFSDCGLPESPLDVSQCQTYCQESRQTCGSVGLPALICDRIHQSCEQICLGQPPP